MNPQELITFPVTEGASHELVFEGFSKRPPFPSIWDNTMRVAFVKCPRLWMYHFLYNLVPVTSKKIDLVAGAAYARGLETYRRKVYDEGVEPRLAVAAGARDLITEYGQTVCPPDNPKSLERMIEALGTYAVQYPPHTDNFKPMMIGGKAAVEFSFSCPIPEVTHPETGEPLIVCGRFDSLAQQNGIETECWVDDEKTTKAMGSQWSEQWKFRSQFIEYVWGARQYGHNCVGALVRGISVQKTQIKHGQALVSIPQWKIDLWYRQFIRDLNRAKQMWLDGYFDYNMGDACTAYGICGYMPLCDTPEPDKWVSGAYKTEVWDPLRLGVSGDE